MSLDSCLALLIVLALSQNLSHEVVFLTKAQNKSVVPALSAIQDLVYEISCSLKLFVSLSLLSSNWAEPIPSLAVPKVAFFYPRRQEWVL